MEKLSKSQENSISSAQVMVRVAMMKLERVNNELNEPVPDIIGIITRLNVAQQNIEYARNMVGQAARPKS